MAEEATSRGRAESFGGFDGRAPASYLPYLGGMASVPARFAPRVLTAALALGGAVILALPSHVSWPGVRAMAPWAVEPTLVIADVAAWGGLLLASVLVLRRPRFSGTVALALALVLTTSVWGVVTLDADVVPLAPSRLSTLGISLLILAAAAAARFWSLFPRPLTAEDVGRFHPYTAREAWTSRTATKGLDSIFARLGLLRRVAEARGAAGERNRIEAWVDRARAGLLVRLPALAWPVGILLAGGVLILELAGVASAGVRFFGHLSAILMGSVAMIALVVRYGVAEETEWRRLLWIAEGFMSACALASFVPLLAIFLLAAGAPDAFYGALPLGYALGALVLIVCLAIAAFWDGVFDPALALRGTALYGLVVVAGVFVFTAVEETASAVLTTWLGLSDQLGTWLGAGTVALLLAPLQRRLDRVVRAWLPQPESARGGREGVGGAESPAGPSGRA